MAEFMADIMLGQRETKLIICRSVSCPDTVYGALTLDGLTVQHGKNPEHRRSFEMQPGDSLTPLLEWLHEVHERDGLLEAPPH